MRFWSALPIAAVLLGGCASSSDQIAALPKLEMRQLTAIEKEALRKSFSQTMKDPDATQFKWLPAVVANKDKPTDTPIGYCGLVNGKNSYGGYVGYKRFYATLTRNAKGEYDRGVIEHIEGTPITLRRHQHSRRCDRNRRNGRFLQGVGLHRFQRRELIVFFPDCVNCPARLKTQISWMTAFGATDIKAFLCL